MRKRIISALLSIAMLIGMLPITALEVDAVSDEEATTKESISTSEHADIATLQANAKITNVLGKEYYKGYRDFIWPVVKNATPPNIQSCFYDLCSSHPNGDHYAIDIAAVYDTTILASYRGVVWETYSSCTHTEKTPRCTCGGGYGNWVIMKHDNYVMRDGKVVTLYTRYSHMKDVYVTKNRDKIIEAGTPLGSVGSSGSSEGYHVDFQILENDPYNRHSNSRDPFSNELLDLPSGTLKYDSCQYAQEYYDAIKALYATPINNYVNDHCKSYPAYGTITIKEACNPYTLPCNSETAAEYGCESKALTDKALKVGDTVTVNGIVFNSENHYWYKVKLSDGTSAWVYSPRADKMTVKKPYLSGSMLPDSISGAQALSGTVITGGVKLNTVWAEVYNAAAKSVLSSSKSAHASTSDYSLKGSPIDNSLKFQELSTYGNANYLLIVFANVTYSYLDENNKLIEVTDDTEIGRDAFGFAVSGESGGSTSKTYTITFQANGGICDTSSLKVEEGSRIGILPNCVFGDYDFAGWYTEPYGGTEVTAETVPTGDMTLWAHYIASEYPQKLVFDANGGIIPGAALTEVVDGVNIGRPGETLVVFNKSGTQPGTNTYGVEAAVNSMGAIVGWRDYGDTNQLTVPEGGFILSGQAGWNDETSSSVGGVRFMWEIEKLIDAGKDVFIFMNYETGEVKVFDSYAGYVAEDKRGQEYTTYGILPIPVREGYAFRGWLDGYGDLVDYYSGFSGIYLTASWDKNSQLIPSSRMEYNGHYYEVYDYNVSWMEADALCKAMGGYLVSITSAAEQSAVMELLKDSERGSYMIGASDAAKEGTWVWASGEPFSYSNWDADSEPSGSAGENYSRIIAIENPPKKQVGEWQDILDNFHPQKTYDVFYDLSNAGFICEFDQPKTCQHRYTYSVTLDPTEETTGILRAHCNICGEGTDIVMPALNQTDYEYTVLVEANCVDVGLVKYTWTAPDGTTFDFGVYIPVTDHSCTGVRTEATCTTQGYTTFTCDVCGHSYVGEYTDALGHAMGGWMVVTEATCTQVGSKRSDCARCDHFETEVIPAIGHNYHAVVTAPTCTEQGYTTHTCACGHSYVDAYTDALGHAMGEWTVVTEATCTQDGSKRSDCSRCDHFETEVIPAIGHNYHAVVTAPTCTEQGYTTHTCACGHSYVDAYTDALGHAMGEWTVVTEATCIEEGSEKRDCAHCDYAETQSIPAVGHDYQDGNCANCGEKELATLVGSGTCGISGTNLSWGFYSDGYLYISGEGAMKDFVQSNLQPWNRFMDRITHVVIADGVTSIGRYAFYNASALVSVSIPDSVASLGMYVFKGATSLEECILPNGITLIPSYAFSGATSLKNIVIPESVTTIQERAFLGTTSLHAVDLPQNLDTIAHEAFKSSGLTEIIIPDSVTFVGGSAFSDNDSLKSIHFGKNVSVYAGSMFSECDGLTEVFIPGYVGSVCAAMFSECTALETVIIEDGITAINKNAFRGCDSLKVFSMPDSVTTIGTELFSNCKNLQSVRLSENLEILPESCFYNCDALTEIVIPASVKETGYRVFYDCGSLSSITFCGDAPAIADTLLESGRIFYRVSATVYYPADNPTWTSSNKLSYGGTITWVPYTVCDKEGHTEVIDAVVAASCTETGLTEGSHCEVCGEILVEQEIVPALGHAMGEWMVVTDATCTEEGSEQSDCSRCDYVETQSIPTTGHNYEDGTCTRCGEAEPVAEPIITSQPADFVGLVGETATFTVIAEGEGLKYQWYCSTDGGANWGTTSVTENTQSVVFLAYRKDQLYRCVITDAEGNSVTTNTVALRAKEIALEITGQPESYVGFVGDEVTFALEANGNGLTYEWFISSDGGATWAKSYMTGYMSDTQIAVLRPYRDGYKLYCKVKDVFGNAVNSDIVSMTVKSSEVMINSQPKTVDDAAILQMYTFTVDAEGDNLTYLWEVSSDGGATWEQSWSDGYNTDTLNIRMYEYRDGYRYRCVVTSGLKTVVITEAAELNLQAPSAAVTANPVNAYVLLYETVTMHMEATGRDLTYQWYYSTDDGATWVVNWMDGYNTDTLTFVAIPSREALYMCKVTDGSGTVVWSKPAQMKILSAKLNITGQPENFSGSIGDTASFTVAAEGDGIRYRWYLSSDGGTTWSECWFDGYNTNTLSFYVNASRASNLYKCVITDAAGNTVTSNTVTVVTG